MFYVVIYNVSPGNVQYVEHTLSGNCLFTKFYSRAKLFNEDEAKELVKHLREKKFNQRNQFHYLPHETQQ